MSGQEAIRIPKAGELVANELRRRIVTGELGPGDQLPTEGQLAEQFQVARTSVREALRILESEGLVSIRRGPSGGGQVRSPDPRTLARYASLLLQFEGATVEDVHAARIMIEPMAARQLATHADHKRVSLELSSALHAEDATWDDPEELARMEGRFHQMLIRATGNETLGLLCSVSNLIVANHVNRHLELSREHAPSAGLDFAAAHRAHVHVVELIDAGDAKGVETLWRRHLEEALVNLGSIGHITVLDLMG